MGLDCLSHLVHACTRLFFSWAVHGILAEGRLTYQIFLPNWSLSIHSKIHLQHFARSVHTPTDPGSGRSTLSSSKLQVKLTPQLQHFFDAQKWGQNCTHLWRKYLECKFLLGVQERGSPPPLLHWKHCLSLVRRVRFFLSGEFRDPKVHSRSMNTTLDTTQPFPRLPFTLEILRSVWKIHSDVAVFL